MNKTSTDSRPIKPVTVRPSADYYKSSLLSPYARLALPCHRSLPACIGSIELYVFGRGASWLLAWHRGQILSMLRRIHGNIHQFHRHAAGQLSKRKPLIARLFQMDIGRIRSRANQGFLVN